MSRLLPFLLGLAAVLAVHAASDAVRPVLAREFTTLTRAEKLVEGARLIRAQGYPCPAITDARPVNGDRGDKSGQSALGRAYRVSCGPYRYFVTLTADGLPQSLRPLP